MFKQSKKSNLSELFKPRKRPSHGKKALKVGLATAAVATVVGALAAKGPGYLPRDPR